MATDALWISLPSRSKPDPERGWVGALGRGCHAKAAGSTASIPTARRCSSSAKAISATTIIPAPNGWSSIEPRRCARARESRRQRPSAFSGKKIGGFRKHSIIRIGESPWLYLHGSRSIGGCNETSIGLIVAETRRIVGRHARCAAAQARRRLPPWWPPSPFGPRAHAGRRRRLADPNPAHTRDDRRRDNGAYCDARAPKTICGASIDAVRDQHHPQSRRKVA